MYSALLTAIGVSLPVVIAQTAAGGELPTWVTIGLTPAVVVALLLTGQIRWGKGVDREMAKCDTQILKAETRAEAAETRERALQQAFMDKVLPQQERQIMLMAQVQTFLQALLQEGDRR